MHPQTQDQKGAVIVVVGPSGAGKDSVIDRALALLPEGCKVALARRVITRPPDAGGESHEAASTADFDRRLAAGAFAVAWGAHGLKYGIPVETIDIVRDGGILIVNGSRSALDRFRRSYRRVTVVNVVAAPEVLAERLKGRGRESEADILLRLERRAPQVAGSSDVVTIDNSGPLDTAAREFAALVDALRKSISG